MITYEEYHRLMEADESFAPGWDAIEEAVSEVYGTQKPEHYGTVLTSRAVFGGQEYLDGYSLYHSEKGGRPYVHIVTFGMSELYGNEKAYGQLYSKWGYEMTIKLRKEEGENHLWAMSMLGNLARYTFNNEGAWFEENQYVLGNGEPIKIDSSSKITSLLIVRDTELEAKDTVHGRLEFLQLVGISYAEAQAINRNQQNLQRILEEMKKDNPLLITNLKRTKEYLDNLLD